MENVLIVSGGKSAQAISDLITEYYPDWQQSAALTLKEAKLLLSQREFDMLVINDCSEDSTEFVRYVSECSDTGVVMLVSADDLPDALALSKQTGAAVVRKQPLNRSTFEYSLGLVSGLRKRLLGGTSMPDKTASELRTIGRAKVALMHYLKFSEEQAHRYLEKQAMDLRIPINEVALRVIKMYDLEAK